MKTINSLSIKANGKDSKIFIENGVLLVATKIGDMKVTSVNVPNGTICFDANGKDVFGVKIESGIEIINALFNCLKSDTARELVLFNSFSEYQEEKSNAKYGSSFKVGDSEAAYKYL